jgi:hypothetical protein
MKARAHKIGGHLSLRSINFKAIKLVRCPENNKVATIHNTCKTCNQKQTIK